jgi:hypothetical protein
MRSSFFTLALSAAAISPSAGMHSALAAPRTIVHARLSARAAVGMRGPAVGRDETEYESYMRKRIESGEDVESTYSDLGVEADFDGGDSGSGAVGDGQVTLDNQHDSPFIVGGGGLRDTVEGASAMGGLDDTGAVVGLSSKTRSKVTLDTEVQASTNARDFKQKNYWGRQIGSGYADQLLDQGKYEDRPVLRQQLENWQNQQSLKSATDTSVAEMTQFFGTTEADQANDWRKLRGRPIDSIRSQTCARPRRPPPIAPIARRACAGCSPTRPTRARPRASLRSRRQRRLGGAPRRRLVGRCERERVRPDRGDL